MEDFRDLRISLEELKPLIASRASLLLEPRGPYTKGIHKYTDPAKPGIKVSVSHVKVAYDTWKKGLMTEKQLKDWAAVMALNDDFCFNKEDKDIVIEWVNRAGMMDQITPIIRA